MTARALIVVDVQNDFCEGGSLAVDGGAKAAADIRSFVNENKGQYDHIVFTRDWHIEPGDHFVSNTDETEPNFSTTWPDHCVADTEGAEFHPEINALVQEDNNVPDTVVSKGEYEAAYSGFEGAAPDGTTLAEWLKERNVEEADVVGIAFDFCVKATAEDAVMAVPFVRVIKRLTASVMPDNDANTTADLENAGVWVFAD
jgi:nicotinamidase/pyrazinamidase